MKKFQRIAVSALALLLVGATFPACGDDGTVKDVNTINVKMLKAGWGEEWVYSLKTNFERVYSEQGYKVNIIPASSDMRGSTVTQDLYRGYEKNNTDLYITGDITAVQVGSNNTYKTGAPLVEDLEELVYNKPAINYQGEEETELVKDKLSQEVNDWIRDTTSYDSDKKYYGVPYVASNAGLVVNIRKLNMYGYEEAPRTSDEVIEMATNIYLGRNGQENSEKSGTYPFTYFNNDSNAGGYGITWMYSMIAQEDYETYSKLLNYADADGNDLTKDQIKAAYESEAVFNTLEFLNFIYDVNLSSRGSKTQTLDQGQAAIMRDGGGVFMANGDWFLNEVQLNYPNYLKDIAFVNYPLSSEVGKKLFVGENTALKLTEDKADELLSYMVKLVDTEDENGNNTSIADIVSSVKTKFGYDITEEDAKTVANARGLHYYRTTESQCYITKGSTKKEIAALFLRMMASDDCAKTIAEDANGTSAFAKEGNQFATSDFVKGASAITVNDYATPYRWFTGGLRKRMGRGSLFPNSPQMLGKIIDKGTTMFDYNKGTIADGKDFSVYTNQAKSFQADETKYVVDNWDSWVSEAVAKQ